SKEAFVATATAIGVIVDVARLPVYVIKEGRDIAALWVPISIAIVATLVGTILGKRYLEHISQAVFRRTVAMLLLVLGAYMLLQGARPFF
ncbi:MAG: TSUP family transporter, partial [Candidatus Eremiobacteraeota bacterium]|nr:TSUP family transporter [Candidatus Eremiobacteraeota bacterium]